MRTYALIGTNLYEVVDIRVDDKLGVVVTVARVAREDEIGRKIESDYNINDVDTLLTVTS